MQPLSWAHVPPLVLVPYNCQGMRVSDLPATEQGTAEAPKMFLDLRDNAPVHLVGHNCQGARHPAYVHIGAPAGVRYRGRELDDRAGPGNGFVKHRSPDGSW
jgi:hypothetical protein